MPASWLTWPRRWEGRPKINPGPQALTGTRSLIFLKNQVTASFEGIWAQDRVVNKPLVFYKKVGANGESY